MKTFLLSCTCLDAPDMVFQNWCDLCPTFIETSFTRQPNTKIFSSLHLWQRETGTQACFSTNNVEGMNCSMWMPILGHFDYNRVWAPKQWSDKGWNEAWKGRVQNRKCASIQSGHMLSVDLFSRIGTTGALDFFSLVQSPPQSDYENTASTTIPVTPLYSCRPRRKDWLLRNYLAQCRSFRLSIYYGPHSKRRSKRHTAQQLSASSSADTACCCVQKRRSRYIGGWLVTGTVSCVSCCVGWKTD